jgi:hypothetical protein
MSTIKSSTTTTTAYSVSADTTGTLVIQTGSTPTTAVTVGTDQSVTLAGTLSLASQNMSPYTGFKNRIINGAMQIWQRATTYALTTSVLYGSADRFALYQATSANGIANQVASGLTGFQYALKLGRNSSATTTGSIALFQALETTNSVDLQGQSVTLSFWAKAGANFSASSSLITVQVLTGTGTDQSAASIYSWTGSAAPINTTQTITTSWVRYSFTGTVSSSATQIGLTIFYSPTGTAGADDNLYITGIQLEKGSTATSFDYRPFGTELALCQRYYQRLGGSSTNEFVGTGLGYTATRFFASTYLKVSMRVAPTSVEFSGLRVQNIGVAYTVTAVTLTNHGKEIGGTEMNVASGLTANQYYYADTSSTSGYLAFVAEL